MKARNINDDSTLAYLFNKTRQGASDALEKAIDAINATIASIQTALNNKVSKAGDTMTGALTLNGVGLVEKNPSYAIGDAPGAQKTVTMNWTDKNNAAIAFIGGGWEADGKLFIQIGSQRTVSGTTKWHHVRQTIALDGTPSVSFGQPAAWRAGLGLGTSGALPITVAQGGTNATTAAAARTNLGLGTMATVNSPVPVANGGTGATTEADARTNLGAVNKAGDTMTGNLTLNISGTPKIFLDHKQANTSLATDSAQRVWDFWFRDKNGKAITYLESTFNTNGTATTAFRTRRIVNGSNTDNGVAFSVAANGTKSVALSDAAAWRSALGLGGMATVASPAPIANGGTGQTAVTTVTTASSIATAASGWTVTSANYSYWGKLAQLKISVKPSSAPGTGETVVATLVSGKRPKLSTVALCPWLNMNYSYIDTDGKIYIRTTSWPASAERWVIATFILP